MSAVRRFLTFSKLFVLPALLLALAAPGWAGWTGGTYTVTANETIVGSVNVFDNATLTINEGVTLTVNSGITIADGKALTIIGPGNLEVKGADGSDGSDGSNGNPAIKGNVIITGATVNATGGKGGMGGDGENGGSGGKGGNGTEEDPASRKGRSYAPPFDLKAVESLIRAFFDGWTGDTFLFPFSSDQAVVGGDRDVADLSPEQLTELSNDKSVILAVLPEITPKVMAMFVLGVSFDVTIVPEESTLKWHGFPQPAKNGVALAAGEEECLFLNDDGTETDTAPTNGHVNVAVKLTVGNTYAPVITAETSATGPTSNKGSGGCDAGLGGVALLALAGLVATKKH